MRYLAPKTLAERLGVPEQTLAQWRHKGTGPAYIRVGKHVRYDELEVERWLEEQTVEPRGAA